MQISDADAAKLDETRLMPDDSSSNSSQSSGYDAILEMNAAEKKLEPEEKEDIEHEDDAEEQAKAKEKAAEKKPEEEKKPAAKDDKKTDKSVVEAVGPDGKPLKVSLETKFKKKIDGEVVELTLGQMLDNEAAEIPVKKRLQAVADDRKKLDTDKATLESHKAQFNEQTQLVAGQLKQQGSSLASGKVDQFIAEYAEMIGASPAVVNSKFREYFVPKVIEYLQADENGRKLLDEKERSGYVDYEATKLRSQTELSTALGQRQRYTQGELQKAGISADEFKTAEAAVINEQLGGNKPRDRDFATADPADIKAYVASCIAKANESKVSGRTDSLISKIDPELKTSQPEVYEGVKEWLRLVGNKYDEETLETQIRAQLGKLKDDTEDEDEAVELERDEPGTKPKDRKRNSSNSNDDEFAEVRRKAAEDPMSVYE